MTENEMRELKRGDIVRHITEADGYVVTGNYGSHVTAARTVNLTNPSEWEVGQKNQCDSPGAIRMGAMELSKELNMAEAKFTELIKRLKEMVPDCHAAFKETCPQCGKPASSLARGPNYAMGVCSDCLKKNGDVAVILPLGNKAKETESPILKPCPLCGSPAEIYDACELREYPPFQRHRNFKIRCSSMSCLFHWNKESESMTESILCWNHGAIFSYPLSCDDWCQIVLPEEPPEHKGACRHGVGWMVANGLNCTICGYHISGWTTP